MAGEADSDAPTAIPSSRRTGTRQLNLRLHVELHERYRRLLRACEDAGLETTMTELLHALLHVGPQDPEAVREIVRTWRRAQHDAL